jgi:hypothetical protein
MLALAAAPTALAQAPGSIELGVGAGRFFGGRFARGSNDLFDQAVDADDDILKGFWVAAQVTTEWQVELDVRRTNTHLVAAGGGVFPEKPQLAVFIPATVELTGIRSYTFGSVRPYVGVGVGFMNVEADTEDVSRRDVNRVAVSFALGARFDVIRRAGLRLDVRARGTYLGVRRLGADRGVLDPGRWFANGELLGGFYVVVGPLRR